MMFTKAKTFVAADCPAHIRHTAEHKQGITDAASLAGQAARLWLEQEGFCPIPRERRGDHLGNPQFMHRRGPQNFRWARIREGSTATVEVWTTSKS